MSGVLVRERSGRFETQRDTGETQRERLCETEAEIGMMCL